MGPRAGLDAVEKRKFLTLSGLEHHPSLVQPVSQSLTGYAIPAPAEISTIENYAQNG
jgi:hypothetical protein